MSFMHPEATSKVEWLKVDGNSIEYLPEDIVDTRRIRKLLKIEDAEALDLVIEQIIWPMIKDYVRVHSPAEIDSIEVIKGYGVRLSAPGYMDCTDWEVYSSIKEANKRARELARELE